MTKRPRLANPVGRSTEAWAGKTADTWPPPLRVRLRIVARQDGKCAVTGVPFDEKNKPEFDHIVRLEAGGKNDESNIQAILGEPHKRKSAAERTETAKVRARKATDLGIKDPPARPIKSRGFNDNALRANDNEKPAPKVAEGESNLARRYRAK